MKVRIVSDGTPANTYLSNAETGERIENVTGVEFEMRERGVATVRVTLGLPIPVDLTGSVQTIDCTGAYRRSS